MIREERRLGRIESDGNGRIRLRADALEPELVRALGELDPGVKSVRR